MPAIEVTAPTPVEEPKNEEENYKTPVIGIIYPPPEVRSILFNFFSKGIQQVRGCFPWLERLVNHHKCSEP